MKFYCEKCKYLYPVDCECVCGNKTLREVTSQDYCFLLESNEMLAKMLENAFIDKGIEYVLAPSGNGYRSALGLSLGNYGIYVLYSQYGEAEKIVEFFNQGRDDDLRNDLIKHREIWNVNNKMQRKLHKKLKLKEEDDLLSYISELVCNATSISDDGVISSCVNGGHYISVKSGSVLFWFNSVTYEIFV